MDDTPTMDLTIADVIEACGRIGLHTIINPHEHCVYICIDGKCIGTYCNHLIYHGRHCPEESAHRYGYCENKASSKATIIADLQLCMKPPETCYLETELY